MQPVTKANEQVLLQDEGHLPTSSAPRVCEWSGVWSTWTWKPSITFSICPLLVLGVQNTVNTQCTLDGYFMFPQTLPLTVMALKCHSYYHWIDHAWVTFALERLRNCCNFSRRKTILLKPPLLLRCTLRCRLVLMVVSASRAGVHTKPPTEPLMFASADQRC